MTKKILKISAYILILLAVCLSGYYYFLSSNDTTGTKKSFFDNLFPFGNGGTPIEQPFATSTDPVVEPPIENFEQTVRLISDEPVAGSVFIPNTKGDMIRYIEKATGHVFDVPTFENTQTRISNTTIPQVYKAEFTDNGAGFIAQYIKDEGVMETMYGNIVGTSTEKSIVGTILSRNINFFAVSPNGKNIFTLEKTQSGSEGYVSLPNGSSRKLVWTSPLKEFIAQYISDTHVGLYSKPYYSALGVLFDINTVNAGKSVVVSNEYNLTTLPNANKPYVLYSNDTGLFARNTANNSIVNLSPSTFSEKCVWAYTKVLAYCAVPKTLLENTSLYKWYRGEVSFSDDIWEYDVVGNIARKVVDLQTEAGRSIDISSISINKKDNLLLIQSKTDGSLWTVKVK